MFLFKIMVAKVCRRTHATLRCMGGLQTELCMALLDYLEGFGIQPIANPMLHLMQYTIIEACHLVPLRITGRLADHYVE